MKLTTDDYRVSCARLRARYCVEGSYFPTLRKVTECAKRMGFIGSVSTIHYRLQAGASTWKELCAPIEETSRKRGTNLARHNEASRAQMAAMIAEIDARKAAIANDERERNDR